MGREILFKVKRADNAECKGLPDMPIRNLHNYALKK